MQEQRKFMRVRSELRTFIWWYRYCVSEKNYKMCVYNLQEMTVSFGTFRTYIQSLNFESICHCTRGSPTFAGVTHISAKNSRHSSPSEDTDLHFQTGEGDGVNISDGGEVCLASGSLVLHTWVGFNAFSGAYLLLPLPSWPQSERKRERKKETRGWPRRKTG